MAIAASSRTLIDFGCFGRRHRFEARVAQPLEAPAAGDPLLIAAGEWLDGPAISRARILHLPDLGDSSRSTWIHRVAREARLKGVIPLGLPVLRHHHLIAGILPQLDGCSVVVLAEADERRDLSMAFLRLLRAGVREACGIIAPPAMRSRLVAQAAEGRAAYDPAGVSARFTLRTGSRLSDMHARRMLAEGRRLLDRGRHADAERTMRAGLAAFQRRGDDEQAAAVAVGLALLLRIRGRALEARALLDQAAQRFQAAGNVRGAVEAAILLGATQTDLDLLHDADRTLRAACSAAAALGDREAMLGCAVADARNLYWSRRIAEATAVLDAHEPDDGTELSVRYWCQAARLRLESDDLSGARAAVIRARAVRLEARRGDEALIRTCEAAIQAALGDLEALEVHVAAGIAAAREAHLPVQAIKLRLALLEGFVDTGRRSGIGRLAAHLRAVSRIAVPALLKRRIDDVLQRTANGEPRPRRCREPRAREALASFGTAGEGVSPADVDGLTQLLSLFHDVDDDGQALARAAATIKMRTHALAVGIYGAAGSNVIGLAAAGSLDEIISRRCIQAGQPIRPERAAGGTQAAVPVRYGGRVIGALGLRWTIEGPDRAGRAIGFAAAAAAAIAPSVHVLLERQAAAAAAGPHFDLIGVSAAMHELRRAIARAADAPFTVLVEGESGSGKELVARAIHKAGNRRERTFAALNCAALPEDLVDTELFGHARGAFSGAAGDRAGLFESAAGGTVFLDEVGELSARAQAKLLRALQEGEIRRVGENFTRPIDARLVAATNRSLHADADAGKFRRDLLYRLDVIRITVPPLRERVEDIPLLAARFWSAAAERIGSKAVLGPGALAALARYDWPGNVRELQNVLTSLVVSAPLRGAVGASALPAAIGGALHTVANEPLEAARLKFEQRYVRAALARSAGHRGRTASALGLSRQGLSKLMQRLQIDV